MILTMARIISAISDAVTPLMARVYPNGLADVNHFHAAGGTRLYRDRRAPAAPGCSMKTCKRSMGQGIEALLRKEPRLKDGERVVWEARRNGKTGERQNPAPRLASPFQAFRRAKNS